MQRSDLINIQETYIRVSWITRKFLYKSGNTLVENNTIEFTFGILKKYVPIEPERYAKNYVVESSIWKGIYNDWDTKVLKGRTSTVKYLYIMK